LYSVKQVTSGDRVTLAVHLLAVQLSTLLLFWTHTTQPETGGGLRLRAVLSNNIYLVI